MATMYLSDAWGTDMMARSAFVIWLKKPSDLSYCRFNEKIASTGKTTFSLNLLMSSSLATNADVLTTVNTSTVTGAPVYVIFLYDRSPNNLLQHTILTIRNNSALNSANLFVTEPILNLASDTSVQAAALGTMCSFISLPVTYNAWAESVSSGCNADTCPYMGFAYDAVYTFAHAIQACLTQGLDPNTQGTNFTTFLRGTSFTGKTGTVAFDDKGDRSNSNYELRNIHEGGVYKTVGFLNQTGPMATVNTSAIILYNNRTGRPQASQLIPFVHQFHLIQQYSL